MKLAGTLAASALVLAGMTTAQGAAATVVAGPVAETFGFAGPAAVTTVGGPLVLVNADPGVPHNVWSDAKRPKSSASWCTAFAKGQCPLFWSETISGGETADVLGLERTVSGTQYTYFCSVHPGMQGTLLVA